MSRWLKPGPWCVAFVVMQSKLPEVGKKRGKNLAHQSLSVYRSRRKRCVQAGNPAARPKRIRTSDLYVDLRPFQGGGTSLFFFVPRRPGTKCELIHQERIFCTSKCGSPSSAVLWHRARRKCCSHSHRVRMCTIAATERPCYRT